MTEPFVVQPRFRGEPDAAGRPARSTTRVASKRIESGATAASGRVRVEPSGESAVRPRTPAIPRAAALDPIAEFLEDPAVTDIFINGADGLFVDRGAGPVRVPQWRAGESDARELAVSLIGLGGRHIDDASPCVDVRLEGGIRVHAVLSPVAPAGAAISIRVPHLDIPELDELASRGLFRPGDQDRLELLVAERVNLLITGAAGVGNTACHL